MAVNNIDILLIRYCFSRIYVAIVASHNAFVTSSTLVCDVNIRTWRVCIVHGVGVRESCCRQVLVYYVV